MALSEEQMRNARIINDVGLKMGIPERGRIIAIATAMQESTLRNLNYGDRDSLGLFQQRPSQGWGSADQITDPQYAATKFYEGLLKVKGWENMTVAQAAQAVQRSAFPDAYAKWEHMATQIVKTLGDKPSADLRDIDTTPHTDGNSYGSRTGSFGSAAGGGGGRSGAGFGPGAGSSGGGGYSGGGSSGGGGSGSPERTGSFGPSPSNPNEKAPAGSAPGSDVQVTPDDLVADAAQFSKCQEQATKTKAAFDRLGSEVGDWGIYKEAAKAVTKVSQTFAAHFDALGQADKQIADTLTASSTDYTKAESDNVALSGTISI